MTKTFILIALILFQVQISVAQSDTVDALEEMRFPRVYFDQQNLKTILEWIETESKKRDPKGVGFTIRFDDYGYPKKTVEEVYKNQKINLDLKDISVFDLLREVSNRSGTLFKAHPRKLIVFVVYGYDATTVPKTKR